MPEGKGSIMIVAGTRPEAIKLAPVIEGLNKLEVDYTFVWSGQHYDYKMSKIFFEQLGLPEPDENLDVRSGTHAEQTAKIMIKLEEVIDKCKPSIIVAEGDTNTVVATALTATKKLIPFAHVEAGLRSWDRTMPEEINRIVADAIAELHFAPTELAAVNLMHEGIPLEKIHVTGNTVVDVVYKYKDYAVREGENLLSKLNLEPFSYILVTTHRQENTDNSERLENIVRAIIELSKKYVIVFPIHPRTVNRLEKYSLWSKLSSRNIHILKPLGYFQFLGLLMKSLIVLTDSGGVQEEACTLKIPTITLRYNTERPETVLVGINKIVGTEWQKIVEEAIKSIDSRSEIIKRAGIIPNPFGDGRAGEKISLILKHKLEEGVEIMFQDVREDPFITYAIKSRPPHGDFNSVVAMYDEKGMVTTDVSKARLFLVRLSHSKALEV